MNKVFLTGRLTRDPEMRSLASGKNVTTFMRRFYTNEHEHTRRLPPEVARHPRVSG